ncbi:heme ABC exporter ATP-binding protein CcmA [Sphingomonas xinjiangensis]|uniref:Heme exporter protein A n=1 Tax=Sphingomonas xinjiangensis TaxID=643568 RepID=A0A840YF41_9SPHN|nr:heme ABC exporter ATP-binding protein CcmA [Sphingomonas xinjiangensis]MBB5711434.1 heme exporter protein A [Sphingomonas xinjiangensis]
MSAALAFEDVACVRGGRLLFEEVGFALGPGDALLVRGPNGVGKSSLIRIAAGLLPPAAGTVRVDGGRALLAEGIALDSELSLGEALRFWAGLEGRGHYLVDAENRVGLRSLSRVPVRLLSTGQRRRAGLARVIASGAPVWLLDEPANGLDSGAISMLEDIVARHRAEGGIAVVATHQPISLPGAQELTL